MSDLRIGRCSAQSAQSGGSFARLHQRRLRSAISACPPPRLRGSSASRVRWELRVLCAMGADVV